MGYRCKDFCDAWAFLRETLEALISDIAFANWITEVSNFEVKGIFADLSNLPATRSHVNRRRILSEIIIMSIMATIAGEEGPKTIGLWAKNHESWLTRLFSFPGGIPSHDTFGRVLMALQAAASQASCERRLRRVSAKHDNGDREIIAIDVKTSTAAMIEPLGGIKMYCSRFLRNFLRFKVR